MMALRLCTKIIRQPSYIRPVVNQIEKCLSSDSKDKETHTGQSWSKEDYRQIRFTDKEKLVNEQFAVNLIDEVPPKIVTSRVVACDGGGGPLGHPKVYINVDQPGAHICGYCGLRFELAKDHH